MSAPLKGTENQARREYPLVLKIKEEIEMKLAKLHISVSKALNIRNGTKLLGGMALGAMLMTAVALPIGGTTYADDPATITRTALDYGDEFVVAEAGRQSLKLTPRAIN